MSPKVGVNLLWLVPGDVGGTEEYAVRLLRHLQPDGYDLTLFALDGFLLAYPELAELGDVRTVPLSGQSRPLRIAAEQTWLTQTSRDQDVMHHLGGTTPLFSPRSDIVTVHDLQPLDMPKLFTRSKATWLGRVIPRSIRSAELVMTPSSFVRNEIISRFGIDPERVEVVASSFGPAHSMTDDQNTLSRHDIDGRYIIYPAITYAHKNHITLVRALERCASDVSLVLTGRPDRAEGALLAEVEKLGLSARVHRVGRVPAGEFETLLRRASLLAFPSRYEGFGLPVIEAMARDVPVLAARSTALPEVVGEAGVLVDALDVGAWADTIDRLLSSPDERDLLVSRGRQRALEFDPAICAARLGQIYRRMSALDP